MKILYYTKPYFADCDFPLIQEMQNRNIDVRMYMPLEYGFSKSVLFDFKNPIKKYGIVKASKIPDMQIFKDCIDLNRLYLIVGYYKGPSAIRTAILWLTVYLHMFFQFADVFHITYHLASFYERKLLHLPFRGKRVVTVHDPFLHSGSPSVWEVRRKELFKWADQFILLNKVQSAEFAEHYGISKENINIAKLGSYDTIRKIEPDHIDASTPYILFFGFISPYKGLKYLLDAMKTVHCKHPEIKLIVAGKGECDFDKSEFEDLGYIEWRYRFIGISELAGLLKNALFAVCPYKDATQSGVIQTAFSMDLPVIATNVGALSKAVTNGETGIVVPPCDVDALAEAMNRLVSNPNMLATMRENIETKWKKDMDWSPIVDKYIECYNL